MTELLIGCGASREKKIAVDGGAEDWTDLYTLDMTAEHAPDVVHDLAILPYPFLDNTFDEIHAYDVMEHIGQQGDWRFFFKQWDELARIMKPGGHFLGISPAPLSPWAWGDPGHTRVIGRECLIYLDRANYEAQVGITPMTDYRPYFKSDWRIIHSENVSGQHVYVLQKKDKPHAA